MYLAIERLYDRVSTIKNNLKSLHENDFYPLIVFPNSFWEKFDQSISYETVLDFCRNKKGDHSYLRPLKKPIEPTKPNMRIIPNSHVVRCEESFFRSKNFHIILWWFVATAIFGLIFVLMLDGRIDAFAIPFIFWFPLLIWALLKEGEKRRTVYKDIPYTKMEMDMLKRKEEEIYEREKKMYPNLLEAYTDELNKYKDDFVKQDRIIGCCTHSFISSLFMSSFSKSEDYLSVDDAPQKGRSEDLLFVSLMSVMPKLVHIDTVFSGYYPDIMVSTSNNINIDIEVDEPYDFGSKKEIHYIGCDDETRNAKFIEKGWIVVRFSEKQIMTELTKCTKIILDIVSIVEKGNLFALNDLLSIKDSIRENRWRKEEARMMAIENYRNSY